MKLKQNHEEGDGLEKLQEKLKGTKTLQAKNSGKVNLP